MLRGRVEEIAGRLASRLVSLDTVFKAIQRSLLSTLDARRALERNVERILAGMNLPSAKDLERVADQLAELDREIARMGRRVAELQAVVSRKTTSKGAPSGCGAASERSERGSGQLPQP